MYVNDDSNITIQEIFLFEIDKSVESGDISFIKNALITYKNQLSNQLIEMANRILMELITEQLESSNI